MIWLFLFSVSNSELNIVREKYARKYALAGFQILVSRSDLVQM